MTYRASSTAKGLGTSITIGKPAGTADGDVIVVGMNYGILADPITPPSGWSLLYSSGDFGVSRIVRVYAKVASSEGASWTWTVTIATNWVIHATAHSDLSTDVPNASGGQVNGSSTSVTAPSITTTKDNCDLVGFFGSNNGSAFTPASGMTERQDDTQGSNHNLELATQTLGSAGSTGTRVATQGTAGASVGWIGAFAPSVNAGYPLYFGTT